MLDLLRLVQSLCESSLYVFVTVITLIVLPI